MRRREPGWMPSASAAAAAAGASLDLNSTFSSVISEALDQVLSLVLYTQVWAVTLPCLIHVTKGGSSTGP